VLPCHKNTENNVMVTQRKSLACWAVLLQPPSAGTE
jgi:hypothetical protein